MSLTRRLGVAAFIVVALGLSSPTPSWAGGAGTLDPSFGTGGKVITAPGPAALAVRYKIAATGSSKGDVLVERYREDGSLDPTFSDDGMVLTDLGSGGEGGYDVQITPRNKVLVLGGTAPGGMVEDRLLRFMPRGRLDPNFGGDGIVEPDPAFGNNRIALQRDGRIVLAGADGDFILERLLAGGRPDATFGGGDGKVRTDVGGLQQVLVTTALIQRDNKIVILGFSYVGCCGLRDRITMVRYRPNGTLDTTFGTNGKVLLPTGVQFPVGFGLQSTGKFVVATSPSPRYGGYPSCSGGVLLRFGPHGHLDTSFGHLGKRPVLPTGVAAVSVSSDDRILVAGDSCSGSSVRFGLTRYLSEGRLDTAFGGDGITVTGFGSDKALVFHLLVQPDGKIMASGTTFNTDFEPRHFLMARYLGT